MKNSITEIAGIITRSFEENFEKMLTEKKDISEFVIEIKKTLDQVGTVLAKEALEMLDSLVKEDSSRKRNWYVHEKSAPNTLATIFGEVHYQRTYYKHKIEKEYRYLSDELVGIDAYDCIFRCGGAAVPEIWKPPVRNWKPLLQSFTHLSSYLIHIIHALKCLSKDQCFQY